MSMWKKVALFIVANALAVGLFLIAPKYPLPSIAVLLLLITNFLCYSLFKARADRSMSQIETNVADKEVTASIRLLRYSASALAFISFITTAEGLHVFVFTEVWQAYLASFAVQSILLVFNFLFFHFYIRINNLERFPLFFKRVLTYSIVFLFTVALIISSTFSFVFIANNTYLSMRAKNSNITIERFLKEETYRLRTINDEIGEDLRTDITDKTKELQQVISAHAAVTASVNEANIDNVLSNFNIIKYTAVTEAFYTQVELDTDLATALYPEEYRSIYSSLTIYKDTYDLIYNDTYLSAYNFYNNLKNASNKSQYTNEGALKAQIDLLNAAINSIDSNLQDIDTLRSRNYFNYISQYKQKALAAYNSLKSSIQSLKSFYETILPEYQVVAASTSSSMATSISVKDILDVVYTNQYNKTRIEAIQAFLSDQQEVLLDESTIDEKELQDLAEFMEVFNDFAKYAELKKQIDDFINDDLSITYYIKDKNETDAPVSAGKLDVVSEAEWTQERKEDFTKFISCLKLLPDVEAHKEKYNESALMGDYEPEEVLQSAYTINRDLLENISGFEKAINYFKYDFSLMAVFSLAMALFLDVASFLTGVFMFAASFFNGARKEKAPTGTDGADEGDKIPNVPDGSGS